MFGQRNWLDRRGRQSVDSDLFLLRGSSHVHPPAHFLPVVENGAAAGVLYGLSRDLIRPRSSAQGSWWQFWDAWRVER